MEKKSGKVTVRVTRTPGSKTKQSIAVLAVPFPKCHPSGITVLKNPVQSEPVRDAELASLAYAIADKVRGRIMGTATDAMNNKVVSFDWYVSGGYLHFVVSCDKNASNVRVVLSKMAVGLTTKATKPLWAAAMSTLGKKAVAGSYEWAVGQAGGLTKEVLVSVASPMKVDGSKVDAIANAISGKIPHSEPVPKGSKKPEPVAENKENGTIKAPGFMGYFLLNYLEARDKTPLYLADGEVRSARSGWSPASNAKNAIDVYISKLKKVKVSLKGKKVDVLGPVALYLASLNGGVSIKDLLSWAKSPKSASDIEKYLKSHL